MSDTNSDTANAQPADGVAGSRPVHFEIHAGDPARATQFYTSVFGWTSKGLVGVRRDALLRLEYRHRTRHRRSDHGSRRRDENPEVGTPVMGAVLTLGVADYDAMAEKILAAGGTEALAKYALPGMAWQGYFHDTENNVFGIHQTDPEAK